MFITVWATLNDLNVIAAHELNILLKTEEEK